MNLNTAKYSLGLALGLILLIGASLSKRRADRMTRLLTCYIGCAGVAWAVLGFLQLASEEHALFFQSLKYFVGGGLVGVGVALFTHLYLPPS